MNRDPGVQPERTAFAWRRTGLAVLINGALVVRSAAEARSPLALTAAMLALVAALSVFAVAWRRSRALLSAAAPASPYAAWLAMVVTTAWLTCVAEFLSIWSRTG